MASFAELVRELAVDGWEPVKGDAAIVVPEHFERVLPVHEPRVPAGHPRRTCSSRTSPPARPTSPSSSCASATASRTARACTSRRARSCSTAPGIDRLGAPGARGSDRLPVLLRGQHREPARPVAAVARRDLRRSPPAALRARRPDRRRRGRLRVRRGPRRHHGGDAILVPGRRRRRARAPTCPSIWPVPKSSPSTVTAVPPSFGTRSAPARRSSAPIRSSTWRRETPWANPESTWRIYSALATVAGVLAARAGRRPASARRPRHERRLGDGRARQLLGGRAVARAAPADGEQPSATPGR